MRIGAVLVAMAMIVSAFGGRLLLLQAFDVEGDASASQDRATNSRVLPADRGNITDRQGRPMAVTEEAFAITADPTMTNPVDEDGIPTRNNKVIAIASIIARHLGGKIDDYLPALTKGDGVRFAYVARKVPAATYARIIDDLNEIGAVGIFRESDPLRSYPNGALAGNLIGFINHEGKGVAGIEYSLNEQLTGTAGEERWIGAPNGSRIPLANSVIDPAVDGTNYQLTLDADIQFMAEQRLRAAAKEVQAESGMVIVMDIKSGRVLAMATTPAYDPNEPGRAKDVDRGNRPIQMVYEPGSVQKILTLAAVIDAGKADQHTHVVVPPYMQTDAGIVKDVWDHGTIHLTTRGIAAKSSNIGTIQLARELTIQQLHDKLTDFGLGQPTGIELPGEAEGLMPEADMPGWRRDQIAFGQGLSVTAIQEAAAIAGILNGGIYNPPTIIDSATDADGNPVDVPRREPRRVVSERTSQIMAEMLEGILYSDGQVKNLGLEGYRTGGKTGTAQRYNADCGCYSGRTTSYAGYAPVEDPQLLTYVVLDDVRKGNTGGGTAGPVFQDVMNFALPVLGILPSTTKPELGGLEW